MEKTIVTFLLDRSGSMMSIRGATIEAFNAYLEGLRDDTQGKADISFTFLQFDTESLDKIHVAVPIAGVPNLTEATFVPRGGTPLIDAAVKTIKAVEDAVARTGGKPKVVVCIQTDGHENASTEHTAEELRGLVSARIAEGWQFNFMGAGIDAYAQAAVMGIGAERTMSYDHTNLNATKSAFRASASRAHWYGAGTVADTSYSAQDRRDAGDRYWKDPAEPKKPETTAAQTSSPKARPKTVDDFSL